MIFEALLGGDRESFFDRYYLRMPFASRGTARTITELATWDCLRRAVEAPDGDVLVSASGSPYAGGRPRTLADCQSLHVTGHTLTVRRAQRHDEQLGLIASEFTRFLGGPTDVQLYFTPSGQFGFDWHFDAEEVFILQAAGVKEYALRKNTVHPWPHVDAWPQNPGFSSEIMPVYRCTLAKGDWLYIPAGYWHRGDAQSDSISAAVGVMAPSAMDVYDFLRRDLLSSLLWRQRLARTEAGGPTDEYWQALSTELARDLGRRLADPELLARCLGELQQERARGDRPP